MTIFQCFKFLCQLLALFLTGIVLAYSQQADDLEMLQSTLSCPIAKAYDQHNQPVYFWQYAFQDGAQDLAMAKPRVGEPLEVKRVTFTGDIASGCHYKALVIARGGQAESTWGWHLAWLAENSAILQYARMDGEAWVSSPTRKLSKNVHLSGSPAILTSDQKVWVVWVETESNLNKIFAVFSDDEGRSWSDAKVIAETANVVTDLQLTIKEQKPYLVGHGIAEALPLLSW